MARKSPTTYTMPWAPATSSNATKAPAPPAASPSKPNSPRGRNASTCRVGSAHHCKRWAKPTLQGVKHDAHGGNLFLLDRIRINLRQPRMRAPQDLEQI